MFIETAFTYLRAVILLILLTSKLTAIRYLNTLMRAITFIASLKIIYVCFKCVKRARNCSPQVRNPARDEKHGIPGQGAKRLVND